MRDRNLRVAVLGPLGTYTHEAAYKRFGADAEYNERERIKDVFDSVLSTADWGVVPQENSTFGSVIETYDNLRRPDAKFVRGEITLQVQHCLLVRRGVKLDDIKKIMSHEQALGQCQTFIASHFPSVSLMKTTSTAAAAQALLDNPPNCAAVCSKICGTLFDGLAVLQEGIQDDTANFTRFFVIAKNSEAWLPDCPQPTRALVQISAKIPSSIFAGSSVRNANISNLLTALQMSVTRIDRRPAIGTVPFHDTYIVELERESNAQDNDSWAREVEAAVEGVTQVGGNAKLIGMW
ncbi:PDT-domain-containing protein [Tricholoma matsutake]|nr:PDT-domain-containing protein [Tricholoma matsutake 945]